jgi:xylulokinase
VTRTAAAECGLRVGTPVLVGCGDFPAALVGSGATRPGQGAEILGTSAIVSVLHAEPLLDPTVCNLGTVEGNWGSFLVLDSGGDALRWTRRALTDPLPDYAEIAARAAEAAPGSDALFFLPYLGGERVGDRNARAQLFGIHARHDIGHVHRAVLEGVAFAVKRHIVTLETATGSHIERLVASGGGAKSPLWTWIRASVYGIPILVPAEIECSVVGCAAMAATALGRFARVEDAAAAYVGYAGEVAPDPAWAEVYAPMQAFFERLHAHSTALWDDLGRLPT